MEPPCIHPEGGCGREPRSTRFCRHWSWSPGTLAQGSYGLDLPCAKTRELSLESCSSVGFLQLSGPRPERSVYQGPGNCRKPEWLYPLGACVAPTTLHRILCDQSLSTGSWLSLDKRSVPRWSSAQPQGLAAVLARVCGCVQHNQYREVRPLPRLGRWYSPTRAAEFDVSSGQRRDPRRHSRGASQELHKLWSRKEERSRFRGGPRSSSPSPRQNRRKPRPSERTWKDSVTPLFLMPWYRTARR